MGYMALSPNSASGVCYFFLGYDDEPSWGRYNGRMSTRPNRFRNRFEPPRGSDWMDYFLPDFYLIACVVGLGKPQRAKSKVD